MQRRLREEGSSFEMLKDEVRRETAIRCLGQIDLPLSRLAEMLGYSEVSALSRSCNRWFATSPRKLRKGIAQLAV
jgi:AraC-like DNA-binding protein